MAHVRRLLPLLCAGALASTAAVAEEPVLASSRSVTVTPLQVTAAAPGGAREARPVTTESVTAQALAETVNVVNPEDALRYLPSVLVRKRHVGDVQDPIATRTSGVGSSARSLVYADGVLLSALIGNNNTFASPRWAMVAAEEIARVDVLYGPFSAAYPGNSMGAVVEITTRAPQRREGSLTALTSLQDFDQYGTRGGFAAWRVAATFGDRWGPFSLFLAAGHTRSEGQPLAYATALRPAASSGAGAPVTGGFADLNRLGQPILVAGAAGLETQDQTTAKLKLGWSPGKALAVSYQLGLFANDTDASAESYLSDGAGAPIYAGAVNLGGYAYALPASAFSNNVYRLQERHWMQSLSIGGEAGETADWSLIASRYDYDEDRQRTPSGALPQAFAGGPGSVLRMDGTGWKTLDLKGVWRPSDQAELSAGAHGDLYRLSSRRYQTPDWRSDAQGPLAASSAGRTRTGAVWAQGLWRPDPRLTLTLGMRLERWRADEGFNVSQAPALSVRQPARAADGISPKASAEWRPAQGWSLRASVGRALRFPTVTELYQAISTGPVLTVPAPDLKPERAWSGELALERRLEMGRVRLSAFSEDVSDALISQSAPLVPGSTTLFSYVQNIPRTRARGLELVAEKDEVLIPGLSLSGSVTYVDAKIVSDAAFPAAEGKRTPQVPRWRATAAATYRPGDRLALTLAARASSRVYASIDNSDVVTHTYQGFDPWLVLDARANLRLDAHWRAALGIENLTDRRYFLFHPFPGRTVTAELRYGF